MSYGHRHLQLVVFLLFILAEHPQCSRYERSTGCFVVYWKYRLFHPTIGVSCNNFVEEIYCKGERWIEKCTTIHNHNIRTVDWINHFFCHYDYYFKKTIIWIYLNFKSIYKCCCCLRFSHDPKVPWDVTRQFKKEQLVSTALPTPRPWFKISPGQVFHTMHCISMP